MSELSSAADLLRTAPVRIAEAGVARFALPLRRPWNSARGSRDTRRGWLIRLRSSDGLIGIGECSPLPGAGTESFDHAARRLKDLLPKFAGSTPETVLDLLPAVETSPAVRCAVETAILDLAATAAGQPLSRLLNPAARDNVAVNAALGSLDDQISKRASDALSQGYQILKLKLGVRPLEQEIAALYALAPQLPAGTRLRLDANGAWDEAASRTAVAALADLPIDALEEPLGGADLEAWRRLQALAPWPLAMDESFHRWPRQTLLADPPARRIVLKPMVTGGSLPALETAVRARRSGIEVIVTTTLDSAVGTWAALHTAAALGTDQTHGLATSGWFAEDVGVPPTIERGQMRIGARPGLGVTPFGSIKFEDVASV